MKQKSDISIKELLQPIVGYKFKNKHGNKSKRIIAIDMFHVIEPDTPGNDWWGCEYDALYVFFEDGTKEPFSNYLEDKLIKK